MQRREDSSPPHPVRPDSELERPAYLGRLRLPADRRFYYGVSTAQAGCLFLLASLYLLTSGIVARNLTMILVGASLVVVFVGVWILVGRSRTRRRTDT